MIATKKLEEIISKSGLKRTAIASALGITTYSLSKKVKNVTEFKASEIENLSKILNIRTSDAREKIFFAKYVECNSTNQRR